MEVSGQLHAPADLNLRNIFAAHLSGEWVGSRRSLNGLGKGKIFCPCRDSNPGSSSPQGSNHKFTLTKYNLVLAKQDL
jgi:hypothetical protein